MSALREPEFRWCVLELCISAQWNIWHKLHHIHRPSSLLVSPILTVCCLSCWPSTKPEMMSNAGTLLYHMLLGVKLWSTVSLLRSRRTLEGIPVDSHGLNSFSSDRLYMYTISLAMLLSVWTQERLPMCQSLLNYFKLVLLNAQPDVNMDCITCPVYSFQNQDRYPHGMLTMIMYGTWTRLLFGILLTFGRLCTNLYKRSDWHYAMMQPVLYGILGTKHPAHV